MATSVVHTNFGRQVVHEDQGGVQRDYMVDPLKNTATLMDPSTVIDLFASGHHVG
jgi:hypothetical protein